MRIETIKPVAAKPGEVVTITGQALTRQSQVKIGDTIVEFTESNGTMAKFIMPETPRAGAFKITVGRYNDPTGTVEGPAKYMLSDNAGDDYPIYMAKASDICSPIGFRDANGDLQVGTKTCDAPAPVAVTDCAADGEVGCKTTTSFKATDMLLAIAGNIKTGVTLAAVAGSVSPSAPDCLSNGAIGCGTTSSYKSADMTNLLAGNIVFGVTIAGIEGNVTLPAVGKVYTGIPYGVNGTGSTGTLTYPAAGNVLSTAPAYGEPGAQLTPSLSTCAADGSGCYLPVYAVSTQPLKAISYDAINTNKTAIRSSLTLSGIVGTLADCSTNAVTGCVTTATYKSADLTNLTAANIKNTAVIAGVTGQYPSATYTLTGSSGADLTNATFNAQIKSSATFQYFGSDGTRNTGTGDINLTATNIANGVSIFGTAGTSTGGAAPDPWDLRAGVTVGSVTGKLKYNCRNTVNSSLYNYDVGLASIGNYGNLGGTALDIWDTIDDLNNNLAGLPPSLVTGWSTDTQCGGVEVTAGDTNVWRDVTTTNGSTASTCAGTPAGCSYKDKISSLEWSAQAAMIKTWPVALSYCSTLNTSPFYNGRTGWRLPTQKELMSGYEHGIRSVPATNFLTSSNYFWSSSTESDATGVAWDVNLGYGSGYEFKYNNSNVVCVRP